MGDEVLYKRHFTYEELKFEGLTSVPLIADHALQLWATERPEEHARYHDHCDIYQLPNGAYSIDVVIIRK